MPSLSMCRSLAGVSLCTVERQRAVRVAYSSLARVDARKRQGDVLPHEGRIKARPATTWDFVRFRSRESGARHNHTQGQGKDAEPNSIPSCTR